MANWIERGKGIKRPWIITQKGDAGDETKLPRRNFRVSIQRKEEAGDETKPRNSRVEYLEK